MFLSFFIYMMVMDRARTCDSLWSVIMSSTTASWASCFSKNQHFDLIKSNTQSIRARTNFKTGISSSSVTFKQTSASQASSPQKAASVFCLAAFIGRAESRQDHWPEGASLFLLQTSNLSLLLKCLSFHVGHRKSVCASANSGISADWAVKVSEKDHLLF